MMDLSCARNCKKCWRWQNFCRPALLSSQTSKGCFLWPLGQSAWVGCSFVRCSNTFYAFWTITSHPSTSRSVAVLMTPLIASDGPLLWRYFCEVFTNIFLCILDSHFSFQHIQSSSGFNGTTTCITWAFVMGWSSLGPLHIVMGWSNLGLLHIVMGWSNLGLLHIVMGWSNLGPLHIIMGWSNLCPLHIVMGWSNLGPLHIVMGWSNLGPLHIVMGWSNLGPLNISLGLKSRRATWFDLCCAVQPSYVFPD